MAGLARVSTSERIIDIAYIKIHKQSHEQYGLNIVLYSKSRLCYVCHD